MPAFSEEPTNIQMFSMTPEEMVFAAKLSDENRRFFCYQLSAKERLICMEQTSNTADESVEKLVQDRSVTEPLKELGK